MLVLISNRPSRQILALCTVLKSSVRTCGLTGQSALHSSGQDPKSEPDSGIIELLFLVAWQSIPYDWLYNTN